MIVIKHVIEVPEQTLNVMHHDSIGISKATANILSCYKAIERSH